MSRTGDLLRSEQRNLESVRSEQALVVERIESQQRWLESLKSQERSLVDSIARLEGIVGEDE